MWIYTDISNSFTDGTIDIHQLITGMVAGTPYRRDRFAVNSGVPGD